jgi:flagellar hook-associated protein 2
MATFGIDGMVSGLDTTTIISQLMQIEAQPQARLKTSVSDAQKQVSAFQTVNTLMLAVGAAADKLQKASTWTAGTATASNDAVTVAAGESPLAGSLTFSVTQLATAKSVVTGEFTARDDPSSITGVPLEIRSADGSTVIASISPSEGSLDEIASAINKATNAGVQAAVVQVSPGHYRLQITSTTTGTAGDFQLTGAGGTPLQSGGADLALTTVSAAQDALVHVGPAGGGYDVTSSSNTIEGLMPGVTVQLKKTTDAVTVTSAANPDATVDAVQGLVDAVNTALGEIAKQSSAGTVGADGTRTGQGILAGSSLLRDLSSQLVSRATDLIGGTSAGSMGLSVSREGRLTLDKDMLTTKLKDDPTAVRTLFAPADTAAISITSRLAELTKNATQSNTGSITLAIDGQNSLIKDLTTRITDWDVRLQTRKETLQRTYSALEVSLSSLKSQSSWLAGQINSLPSSSGSK